MEPPAKTFMQHEDGTSARALCTITDGIFALGRLENGAVQLLGGEDSEWFVFENIFAKRKSFTVGAFILRIEDTDRARIVKDAVKNLHETLQWLNIVPDEGPSPYYAQQSAPCSPYTQSERLEHYRYEILL